MPEYVDDTDEEANWDPSDGNAESKALGHTGLKAKLVELEDVCLYANFSVP